MIKFVKTTNMDFEWDENKNKLNQVKHGIDFNDAKAVFKDEKRTKSIDNGQDSVRNDGLLLAKCIK